MHRPLLLSFALLLFATPAFAAAPVSMVEIPAGAHRMGSDSGPEDERPAHEVFLAACAIDRLPVTNAAFAEFLNAAGPKNAKGERLFDDDDPDARIHLALGRWRADPGVRGAPRGGSELSRRRRILRLGGQAPAHGGRVGEGGARRRRPALPVGQRSPRRHTGALWRCLQSCLF